MASVIWLASAVLITQVLSWQLTVIDYTLQLRSKILIISDIEVLISVAL